MSIDRSRRAFFTRLVSSEPAKDIGLPWLLSKSQFFDKCTQCGYCLDACPEKIIKKGDGGFPTVDFSLGECTYCQACTEQCPESLFDSTENSPWDLVLAIDSHCFAKRHVVCQSCKDACDAQAIQFDLRSARIPLPQVDTDACTKCGACVAVCPANAISLTELTGKVERSVNEKCHVE